MYSFVFGRVHLGPQNVGGSKQERFELFEGYFDSAHFPWVLLNDFSLGS